MLQYPGPREDFKLFSRQVKSTLKVIPIEVVDGNILSTNKKIDQIFKGTEQRITYWF